jgi:hypothetical protein
LKYTINALNYIEIFYQYNALKKVPNTLVSFKIHLFTIKITFLCFNIHAYTFQIHYNIFQKPYILLTCITIPLLYSNILPYMSIYVEIDLKPFYSTPLCLVTTLFFKTVMAPHYAMTCLLKSKNEAFSMNPINPIG